MSIIDPRLGDIEDDASSTKRRSLFRIAGSLLAEISLPKLVLSWLFLMVLPSLVLGITPLLASAWLATLSRKIGSINEGWPLLLLLAVLIAGWFGGKPLFQAAEQGFWSLNALALQPGYALCREVLRHLTGRTGSHRFGAATAVGAGLVLSGMALGVVLVAWPATRWIGGIADLAAPHRLIVPALANAAVLMSAYLAAASLTWGIADATMDQPRDLLAFDRPSPGSRTWRVAHLSDLHVVGERFGFRIESGRSGPCGNERLERVLARLDAIHAREPLDIILMTGDITDAGRSPEWAEFLAAMASHPQLAQRTLLLPGNHDVNIVDRANPARLDLPISPGLRLRQMRALAAMAALQGDRVRLLDPATHRLGGTLSAALAPHLCAITAFADTGALRLSISLARVWAEAFPMVLPPETQDGLGVVLFNSTAETHFSFTNALGLVPLAQMQALAAVLRQFPQARWIVALHHHVVEYPRAAAALSERIGTALINGTWFVRQLQPFASRIVAMHGHRHVDWIGECGGLRIVSAPSPVMEATDDEATCFHIHTLAADQPGKLGLLEPERIDIPGTGCNAGQVVSASHRGTSCDQTPADPTATGSTDARRRMSERRW